MPSYDWIHLQEKSSRILNFLSGKEPMKSEEIAAGLGDLTAR